MKRSIYSKLPHQKKFSTYNHQSVLFDLKVLIKQPFELELPQVKFKHKSLMAGGEHRR